MSRTGVPDGLSIGRFLTDVTLVRASGLVNEVLSRWRWEAVLQ
jgi:hypothetical protein